MVLPCEGGVVEGDDEEYAGLIEGEAVAAHGDDGENDCDWG